MDLKYCHVIDLETSDSSKVTRVALSKSYHDIHTSHTANGAHIITMLLDGKLAFEIASFPGSTPQLFSHVARKAVEWSLGTRVFRDINAIRT